jgi:putative ABC transport system permease protein
MELLVQDVRYALVIMRRSKAFTAAALATLALGIGATTAVFSVVYGVLLRPLPYPAADRLVHLSEEHPGAASPLRVPMLSNLTYYAWSAAPRTVESFAAYRTQEFTVEFPGGASRMTGATVTPSLFGLIGQTPARGRFFHDDEGREGNGGVVVLSDRAWRERFNADPSVVGRGLVIDDKPAVIVGVARPGFEFPARDTLLRMATEVLRPSPDAVSGLRGRMSVINGLARLRVGATTAQAEAEGTAAARSVVRPMADNMLFGIGGPPTVHVRSEIAEVTLRIRPALMVLAVAVVCVLLIACANVANLFLSRGVARQRELTLRAAIGASQGRLARQLLTESLVLSTIGGTIGIVLARLLVSLAPMMAPRDFPRLDNIVVDTSVVAFAVFATLATAVLSGLAPALQGTRVDLVESLHGGDGATAGGFRGRRAQRLRDALLVAEAAFAVLLLVAAALLARSFVRLVGVDAGYTADNVVAAEVVVPGGDADDKAVAMQTLIDAILDRTRATPDVVVAGATSMMPLGRLTLIAGFPAPWRPPGAAPANARTLVYRVTPGYAEAIALRLKQGRFLRASDRAGGTNAWVVNEEFARQYLPPNPLGYQWKPTVEPGTPERVNEIVGIVANVLMNGNDARPQPEIYQIARDGGRFGARFQIVVRTAANPALFAPVLRGIIREAAPTAAIETNTLAERVARSVDEPRFAMAILVAFAALALALASVGLYGVLSYAVSQRRRELGVRAALGASRTALVRLVVRQGLGATTIGLVIGLLGAAALTRLMRSVLFGVAPLDPISFSVAPLVLVPVALLACAIPARRAAAADPSESLRCE